MTKTVTLLNMKNLIFLIIMMDNVFTVLTQVLKYITNSVSVIKKKKVADSAAQCQDMLQRSNVETISFSNVNAPEAKKCRKSR